LKSGYGSLLQVFDLNCFPSCQKHDPSSLGRKFKTNRNLDKKVEFKFLKARALPLVGFVRVRLRHSKLKKWLFSSSKIRFYFFPSYPEHGLPLDLVVDWLYDP
jgi:hypothetical protein